MQHLWPVPQSITVSNNSSHFTHNVCLEVHRRQRWWWRWWCGWRKWNT
jgi:hypothetical protein